MPETVKERSELDPQFTWDLSRLFADDAAWEKTLATLEEKAAAVTAWAGKLKDAASIHGYFEAATALSRTLSDLFCYASMRHSEDTRAEAAQSMYARISAQYARVAAALSFAEPEILALPEDTLQAVAADPQMGDYRFAFEDLLRQKPHTLSAAEEKLRAFRNCGQPAGCRPCF